MPPDLDGHTISDTHTARRVPTRFGLSGQCAGAEPDAEALGAALLERLQVESAGCDLDQVSGATALMCRPSAPRA